jgi:glycosyltransferase involved in cell wall biosynthesis
MSTVSVVVCSREPAENTRHQRNVAKTIGCEYEYIRIDNTTNKYGICEAYNFGAKQAKGSVILFVHEDVFFMEPGWGPKLLAKFQDDASVGLVGVAGTQYLSQSAFWPGAGRPYIRGRVIHEIQADDKFYMTVFHRDMVDTPVVAIDGLFMAARASLFKHVQFDAYTFDKFHLYDMDISMQIGRSHTIMVTYDILLKHLSRGDYDHTWKEYAGAFAEKYEQSLPRSCVSGAPPLNNPDTFECCDLRGRVSTDTIL